MQLAGPGVFGPPKDHDAALAVLREAVARGVNHIDTSDYYGPHVIVNPEGSVDPPHLESAEAAIALCLVLQQALCLRWRSALVPKAKRSESRNSQKYAWRFSLSPPK
jgi:hypothetical protein